MLHKYVSDGYNYIVNTHKGSHASRALGRTNEHACEILMSTLPQERYINTDNATSIWSTFNSSFVVEVAII